MNNVISTILFSTVILYSIGAYVNMDSTDKQTAPIPVAIQELDHMENIKATNETEKKETLVKYDLPDDDTYFKTYMSYKAITNTRSAQYKLQQDAWTDENGLRRIGDDYMIAVGTFYSSTVGERFKITLANGFEFYATVGDIKADKHTDSMNMYTPVYSNGKVISANVIEFIVDTPSLPKKVRQLGTVSGIEDFEGNILTMEKVKE